MSSSVFRTVEARHELHVSVDQEYSSARDVEEREEGEYGDDDPSQRSEVGVVHHLVEIDEGIHDVGRVDDSSGGPWCACNDVRRLEG